MYICMYLYMYRDISFWHPQCLFSCCLDVYACMHACMHACMYVSWQCFFAPSVSLLVLCIAVYACMHACLHACMYPDNSFWRHTVFFHILRIYIHCVCSIHIHTHAYNILQKSTTNSRHTCLSSILILASRSLFFSSQSRIF